MLPLTDTIITFQGRSQKGAHRHWPDKIALKKLLKNPCWWGGGGRHNWLENQWWAHSRDFVNVSIIIICIFYFFLSAIRLKIDDQPCTHRNNRHAKTFKATLSRGHKRTLEIRGIQFEFSDFSTGTGAHFPSKMCHFAPVVFVTLLGGRLSLQLPFFLRLDLSVSLSNAASPVADLEFGREDPRKFRKEESLKIFLHWARNFEGKGGISVIFVTPLIDGEVATLDLPKKARHCPRQTKRPHL